MAQLSNDNTPYNPKMGDGSKGVIQCVHGGSTHHAYLWGSLNGTDYALLDSFLTSVIKELVLVPYVLVAGSATDKTVDVNAATKVYIDETR
jgi:hypothetical protein|tara:strand:+ start:616 stop:888 length:273 start_codon:yes stop_codon:yes gene_type:complete